MDKSYRIFRFASKSQIKNLILADFGDTGVWQFQIQVLCNVKHQRPCLTTFPNTEKGVEIRCVLAWVRSVSVALGSKDSNP